VSQSALRLPSKRLASVEATQWHVATAGVAIVVLVLLGARLQLNHTVTVGYVAALVIAPLWLGVLGKFRGVAGLFLVGIVCCLSGFWLLGLNSSDHQVDQTTAINNVTVLLGLLLTVGVVLWAKQVMPEWLVGLSYGVGLLSGVTRSGAAENMWKFGYAVPVIIISLSIAYWIGRWGRFRQGLAETLALSALAVMCMFNDSRSMFGMLGMVIILVIWQLVPRGKSGRRSVFKTLVALICMALAMYDVLTSLLVEGYLGASAQARSVAQINMAGNLILGGRPEIAATWALFEHNPLGFGLGIIPSLTDIAVAKTGMTAINYQPDNGYVENYMFGTQFEVHSTFGDLWAIFGLPGLALAAVMAAWAARTVVVGIAHGRASALPLFLANYTLWNIFFSPLLTSVAAMGLGLGLMLPTKSQQREPSAAGLIRDVNKNMTQAGGYERTTRTLPHLRID
jgi:hypothetical protein